MNYYEKYERIIKKLCRLMKEYEINNLNKDLEKTIRYTDLNKKVKEFISVSITKTTKSFLIHIMKTTVNTEVNEVNTESIEKLEKPIEELVY